MVGHPAGRVGYAPAGWTHLSEHLRGNGFTDAEILGAGLGTRASTGRAVDRFRDRLMFPIHARAEDGDREVVGFIGRRNPSQDASTDTRNPKYLNTGQTPLYTKGEHLYGLAGNTATLDRGGLAVLVEGPIDALAVDLASGGMMAGLTPLGTALTGHQAGQLADALGAGTDRIVIATDADPAGVHAPGRAYELLTAHGLDPRRAALPAGTDPAQLGELHGPAALVDRLATAEPMGRQLVDDALTGRDLTWPEDRVAAARIAAGILAKAPLDTWQRELTAVSARTGLPADMLQTVLAERIGAPDAYVMTYAHDGGGNTYDCRECNVGPLEPVPADRPSQRGVSAADHHRATGQCSADRRGRLAGHPGDPVPGVGSRICRVDPSGAD